MAKSVGKFLIFQLTVKMCIRDSINTGETMISLQDSILVTFLNLAGFDILFFVPTGYQLSLIHI